MAYLIRIRAIYPARIRSIVDTLLDDGISGIPALLPLVTCGLCAAIEVLPTLLAPHGRFSLLAAVIVGNSYCFDPPFYGDRDFAIAGCFRPCLPCNTCRETRWCFTLVVAYDLSQSIEDLVRSQAVL